MSKSAPGWRIAAAADKDLAEIAALISAAYRGDEARLGWTTEAWFIEGQRTDAALRQHELAEAPEASFFVRRRADRDRIEGCVLVERAAAGLAADCYVGMLAVSPRLQGGNLGGMLLAHAERTARERGVSH